MALHINDTHPTLVIPELMRILMDVHGIGWDQAWGMTTRMVSYTNHTILSEALEKWPLGMVKELLPRIFLIIEEINARFCGELMSKYPGTRTASIRWPSFMMIRSGWRILPSWPATA